MDFDIFIVFECLLNLCCDLGKFLNPESVKKVTFSLFVSFTGHNWLLFGIIVHRAEVNRPRQINGKMEWAALYAQGDSIA